MASHTPRDRTSDDPAIPPTSPHTTSLTGVYLLLAAALLWSLNGAFIKAIHANGRGPDGITIAFYRSVFGGFVLLPLAWSRLATLRSRASRDPNRPRSDPGGHLDGVTRTTWAWLPRLDALLCAVFFATMTGCFVVANTMTEAGNAIVLQYTSTLWLFLLSPWLLRERPRTEDAWILALAMLGVGVIFFGNAGRSLPGLIVALASGFFYALLTLMIRRLRDADPAAVTVLNNFGAAILLFLPVCLWGTLTVSRREFLLLALMGVVQFAIPYYLYARGLARVPAYQAGLITLAEPVLVPVWTFLVVGEVVPPTTLAGGALLLASIAVFLQKSWRRMGTAGSTAA